MLGDELLDFLVFSSDMDGVDISVCKGPALEGWESILVDNNEQRLCAITVSPTIGCYQLL